MSLDDAVEDALPYLRDQAVSRMRSRATICRKTGETTTDTSGYPVPVWSATTGVPLRIGSRRGALSSKVVDAGGTQVAVSAPVAHFPIGTDVRDGDLFEITSGEGTGQVYRVVETAVTDQATALRLAVVGTTRPKEWP